MCQLQLAQVVRSTRDWCAAKRLSGTPDTRVEKGLHQYTGDKREFTLTNTSAGSSKWQRISGKQSIFDPYAPATKPKPQVCPKRRSIYNLASMATAQHCTTLFLFLFLSLSRTLSRGKLLTMAGRVHLRFRVQMRHILYWCWTGGRGGTSGHCFTGMATALSDT